jgi:hypothetical protein
VLTNSTWTSTEPKLVNLTELLSRFVSTWRILRSGHNVVGCVNTRMPRAQRKGRDVPSSVANVVVWNVGGIVHVKIDVLLLGLDCQDLHGLVDHRPEAEGYLVQFCNENRTHDTHTTNDTR